MARLLDVIEYADPFDDEIVKRVPESGSGEFRIGSQLVVREGQTAVFFADGRALDTFGPGRYTLDTANLPLLTELISVLFGGKSPFRAEVYFVNQREFIDMRWGTPEPIAFRDQDLGVVRLRSFGTYNMRVENPQLFITKVVGNRGVYTTDQVEGFLRNVILTALSEALGEQLKSLYDLPRQYDELGVAIRLRVREHFASLGLEVRTLLVSAILPPEDVQKAIDERSAMSAIGEESMDKYLKYKAGQALGDAAQQPGGGGAITGGVEVGVGAGVGMAMAEAMRQRPAAEQAKIVCPKCKARVDENSAFCPKCGQNLTNACKACGKAMPPGATYCPSCGAKVEP